jgi:hypothetical protein
MLDLLPNAASPLVGLGAAGALCKILSAAEYIDLAEEVRRCGHSGDTQETLRRHRPRTLRQADAELDTQSNRQTDRRLMPQALRRRRCDSRPRTQAQTARDQSERRRGARTQPQRGRDRPCVCPPGCLTVRWPVWLTV